MIKELKKEAKKLMGEGGCHDWDHVMRVFNLAINIGKKEDVNIEILELATILHDIARPEESKTKGKICHAKLGAKMAKDILKKYNYSEEIINAVEHCILAHRNKEKVEAKTKEAKVLFDADKIDSLGAIGLGRAFIFAGEHGAKVHNTSINIEDTCSYTVEDTAYREYWHYSKKMKDKLYTKEGKKIAKKRILFMKNFFKKLDNECAGKS